MVFLLNSIKKFWPLISDSFIRCANECFEKGEMSCTQKQAVITLIEKKGKDHSFSGGEFDRWPRCHVTR